MAELAADPDLDAGGDLARFCHGPLRLHPRPVGFDRRLLGRHERQRDVTDATHRRWPARAGKFPITGLTGAGISVSGTLFGASVTGAAFFDILDVDSNGNPIRRSQRTTVANRIFYGGIEGGISFAGAAGFKVRLGISSLGPLDAFSRSMLRFCSTPTAGWQSPIFMVRSTLTSPSPRSRVPRPLRPIRPSLRRLSNLSDWEKQLAGQVATQASLAAAGMNVLDGPITISAGATFFDEYASQYAFQLAGNVVFDTTGKFEASGTLTLGNEVSIKGAVYVDLSHAAQGNATILLYAEAPVQAPILTFYGSVAVTTGGDLDLNGTNQYARHRAATCRLITRRSLSSSGPSGKNGRAETVISQGTTNGFQAGFNASNDFVVTFGGKTLTYANTDENWHHWAVTFDDTTETRTLYEDGEKVATDTTSAISGRRSSLYIGQSGQEHPISTARSTLSASGTSSRPQSEIQNNYLSGSVTPTANLIGDWNFDTGPPPVGDANLGGSFGQQQPHGVLQRPVVRHLAGSTPAPFARDSGFEIDVSGEVDLTVPSLPEKLSIIGNASFQVDLTNTSLDLSVTGSADLDPLGQLAALAGNVHFDDTGGSPHLYGALIVESDLGQIPALQERRTDRPTPPSAS